MKYIIFAFTFLFYTQTAYPLGVSTAIDISQSGKQLIKSRSFTSNAILVKSVSIQDLRLSSRADNISLLLNKATQENKVKGIDYIYYYKQFNDIKNGDEILLKCLQVPNCQLDSFLDIVKNKSNLHKQIISRYPSLNLTQTNQKAGKFTESFMTMYFQESGWKRINGEIGRNGIDGLFYRKVKNGIKVLLVESKYGTAQLSNTKAGMQMSKSWALEKVQRLKAKYPDDEVYPQIEMLIINNQHKSRLWNFKVTDRELLFDLKKICSTDDTVSITPLTGGEKTKLIYKDNYRISLENPVNKFQKKMVNWYKTELNNI